MSLDTEKLQYLEALIKRLKSLSKVTQVGEEIAKAFGYDAGCLAVYKKKINKDSRPLYTFYFGESNKILEDLDKSLQKMLIIPGIRHEKYMAADEAIKINASTMIYNTTVVPLYNSADHIGVIALVNWKETRLNSAKSDLEKVCTLFVPLAISLYLASEDIIVYRSDKMQEIGKQIKLVSPSDARVLILGETGVGKELVAKAVHYSSPRAEKEMIICNGGNLRGDPNIAYSELFGHLRGSFAGATSDRKGKFEEANGSTLFIDEVAEIIIDVQPILLRAIEDGLIQPLGGTQNNQKKVNVRLITATNRDLDEMERNGKFRGDLLARIRSGITINIPPLRNRREDIPELIKYFLTKYSRTREFGGTELSDNNIEDLVKNITPVLLDNLYSWHYNVRDVQWLVTQMLIFNKYDSDYVKELLSTLESRVSQASVTSLDDLNTSAEKVKQALIEYGMVLTQRSNVLQNPDRGLSPDERQQDAVKCMENGESFTSGSYARKYGTSTATGSNDLKVISENDIRVKFDGKTKGRKYYIDKNSMIIQ